MSAAKWFDTDAELQKLRETLPHPPKVEAEDPGTFSQFSHFSRGEETKAQIFASSRSPLGVEPGSSVLGVSSPKVVGKKESILDPAPSLAEAELQELGSPPAKLPKASNVEDEDKRNFSRIRCFRGGEDRETQNPPSLDPLAAALLHDDAEESAPKAVTWLCAHLQSGPQRIADLMKQWCLPVVGHSSREIGARIDPLNEARWELGVEPFVGKDGKFWWRLPRETGQ